MKALLAARFNASYLGFLNPTLADSCVLVSLHLRSTYAEVADTFSGAIARWSRRTVRTPVSAVLQAFGAISSMVSPMRPHRSQPGEPVLNRTATLVAITLISAFATPVVVNATASCRGCDTPDSGTDLRSPDQGGLCRVRRSPGSTLHHSRPLSRCAARG